MFAITPGGFSSTDQKGLAQSSRIRSRYIRAPIPNHHTFAKLYPKFSNSSSQHPSARLPILVFAFVHPYPVHGMAGAKIDGIELNALRTEFCSHESHQRVEIGLRIIATRDSRLIRNNDQPISKPHRGPTKRKDSIDKPHFLGSMKISHLFIYYSVPIEE
ncbi:hypothetical protein HDF14_000432 [Edaphobacter lichenicola]|uniref:Uncharacterized protein n=1 Tax=Tunturiibacter gelidiferens TaxID=3069689 RepID=A0A9X0QAR0_9BACT|nr:hypothetical protein [Edaphobacter lichenicola]